jgi:hypothetical protein
VGKSKKTLALFPCYIADVSSELLLQVWEETPGYGERPFMEALWAALDEAISLTDCDIYSYKSDGEDDPFGVLASSHVPLRISGIICSLFCAICHSSRLVYGSSAIKSMDTSEHRLEGSRVE